MKITNAKISLKEHNLSSATFNDIYHSSSGALEESLYVFIQGNKLTERWNALHDSDRFNIAEIGFGTGLNFFLTLKTWREQTRKPKRLFYTAFEKYPITKTDLATIYKKWPNLTYENDTFINLYPDHTIGCHRLLIDTDITLDLIFGCANHSIDLIKASAKLRVDAWYLDGFSPNKNPELWSYELFEKLAFHSAPDSTFSTYTAAGAVARNLRAAGFKVKKIDGYGKKRHSLIGILDKTESKTLSSCATPWLNIKTSKAFETKQKEATIIGAGLAGGTVALALARRGWKVTIVEAANQVLHGASGIDQLALRCRLFAKNSSLSLFFLHSYLFSKRYYSLLNNGSAWNETGLLQLGDAKNKRKLFDLEKIIDIYDSRVVQKMSPEIAASLVGLRLQNTALTDNLIYFPEGGWVDSLDLSSNLFSHPNISVSLNHSIDQIIRENNTWHLTSCRKKPLSSPVVVVASSFAAKNFECLKTLPLREIYGQATKIPTSPKSERLNKVVCGERSVFPENGGHHTISASYFRPDQKTLSPEAMDPKQLNKENISRASSLFCDNGIFQSEDSDALSATRSAPPDFIPIIGLAPNFSQMRANYLAFTLNKKTKFEKSRNQDDYHEGLYLSVGHGSNGAATCPFAGEIIASLIARDPLPVSGGTFDELSASRFIILDLKRQKIRFA